MSCSLLLCVCISSLAINKFIRQDTAGQRITTCAFPPHLEFTYTTFRGKFPKLKKVYYEMSIL